MTTGQWGVQEPFHAELIAATTRAKTAARSCSGIAMPATNRTARASTVSGHFSQLMSPHVRTPNLEGLLAGILGHGVEQVRVAHGFSIS